MIALDGQLTAADPAQVLAVRTHLPAHVALSRAEPGCLRFDVTEAGPGFWRVEELFSDAAAFAAHQARTRASDWGRATAGVARDFARRELAPAIRDEAPGDAPAIAALLDAAFGGTGESRIVARLRRDGDLALSLAAEAAGVILGHVALSPLAGDLPGALALAPLAVTPKAQGRGLGGMLVRAALDRAGDAPVVVLGDPGYYARFGFRPVPGWDSPYAGPHLMALGRDLPERARIVHAPAFG